MRMLLKSAIVVLSCSCTALGAEPAKPLATQFVGCVRGAKGVDVASREIKTPLFTSRTGAKAFGKVIAQLQSGSCQNRTTLYIAPPHGVFEMIWQQDVETLPDGSIYDGNGIEAIQWAPSGDRILVRVSQWTWGSDFGESTKDIVYKLGDRTARPISPVQAVSKRLRHPCNALIKTTRWIDDRQIEVLASPYEDRDEEGTRGSIPTCVQKTARFSFSVDTGKVRSISAQGSR